MLAHDRIEPENIPLTSVTWMSRRTSEPGKTMG